MREGLVAADGIQCVPSAAAPAAGSAHQPASDLLRGRGDALTIIHCGRPVGVAAARQATDRAASSSTAAVPGSTFGTDGARICDLRSANIVNASAHAARNDPAAVG